MNRQFTARDVSNLAKELGYVLLQPTNTKDPNEPLVLADTMTEETVSLTLQELLDLKSLMDDKREVRKH